MFKKVKEFKEVANLRVAGSGADWLRNSANQRVPLGRVRRLTLAQEMYTDV